MKANNQSRMLFAFLLLGLLAINGCGGKPDEGKNPKDTGDNKSAETSDSPEFVLLKKIARGETNGAEKPEGWQAIDSEELACSFAWPAGDAPTEYSPSIDLDGGDLTFVLGSSERDEEHAKDYTHEAVCNLTEAGMRVGNTKILSEDKTDGGCTIRFVSNQGDEYTQVGRIYVTDTRNWIVAATFKNGKHEDPRIQYFFENFKANY